MSVYASPDHDQQQQQQPPVVQLGQLLANARSGVTTAKAALRKAAVTLRDAQLLANEREVSLVAAEQHMENVKAGLHSGTHLGGPFALHAGDSEWLESLGTHPPVYDSESEPDMLESFSGYTSGHGEFEEVDPEQHEDYTNYCCPTWNDCWPRRGRPGGWIWI